MSRQDLRTRLAALAPPRSAACLVLLCSYFEKEGLQKAEGELQKQGEHPLDLLPISEKERPADMVRRLGALPDSLHFDVLALRWLKRLDLRLAHQLDERQDEDPMRGIDGVLYRLRRRNEDLAKALGDVTWEADQSRSTAAYCRHHKLVPAEPVKGIEIECRTADDWGDPYLHRRLKRLLSGRDPPLRVMLWPFLGHLDFEVEDWTASGKTRAPKPIRCISLRGVRNESDLLEDTENALAEARSLKVAILVFPELVMTSKAAARVREVLSGHGADGFPILTLFGCCHRRCADGRADVNEALLLGPDGSELCSHQKLTHYTNRDRRISERLDPGEKLTVLECGFGNLVPLICLDFVNPSVVTVISATHGNVLLVPSLSPKTSTYTHVAAGLHASNRACSFVCNRRFEDPQPCSEDPAGTSFYRAGRSVFSHFPQRKEDAGMPFVLFDAWTDQQRIK
jgi:hypothetical protein